MLHFKVDENLPTDVAALLTGAGHDAVTVVEQQLGGQSDPNVAVVCQQEGRAIVTLDLDFADIRVYSPIDFSGIIVLRLARLDKPRVLAAVTRVLPLLNQEPLVGKLWIVTEAMVRIRD
jgi:predicted nuclease of predicted toxin-antitoxin system